MERHIKNGIEKFLLENSKPWHMPGHKRKSMNALGEGSSIDDALANAMSVDVTEVPGTDDLYEPSGIIRDSLHELKESYGTCASYYLVNGATGGILSAIYAANGYIEEKKSKTAVFGIADNCHKSVFNGVRLVKGEVKYINTDIYRQNKSTLNMCGAVELNQLEKLFESEKVDIVIITSPTYEGIISDIAAIAEIVHKNDALLIVDEAHGAHLPFFAREKSALYLGADIVVQSLHKTLPALTQTAIIHLQNTELKNKLEEAMQIFMSSSPSYPMLYSMEAAVAWAVSYDYTEYSDRLRTFRKGIENKEAICLLDYEEAFKYGAWAYDESRIVISTREKNISGLCLAALLKQLGNIVVEMSGTNYVVLISTAADTMEDFLHLQETLTKIDTLIVEKDDFIKNSCNYNLDGVEIAIDKDCENRLQNLCGKVAGSDMYVYPPGNYIVRKGEYVTSDMIDKLIDSIKSGLVVRGL